MNDFMRIEGELQKRRAQAESVGGKDTPYRVEFRFSGGTKHWQYFCTESDCEGAKDAVLTYGPTGRSNIETPRSQQVQVRGPKGGWKPLRK